MPCNGIAVATAIVNSNLTELFFNLPQEQRVTAIASVLSQQIPELASLEPTKLPWEYDRGVTDFGFKLGAYMVGVYKDGRIFVSQARGEGKRFAQNQNIQELVSSIVSGLGGYVLQQQLIGQIGQQATITGQQVAPNGAIVLDVEI